MANTERRPAPAGTTRPPAAARAATTGKTPTVSPARPAGKPVGAKSTVRGGKPAGRTTTRSATVAAGRFGGGRKEAKSGGAGIYLISGIVIGLGLLYLLYGGGLGTPAQTQPTPNEPARKGVSTNFVPPKISEKVISDKVASLKRESAPAGPADEAALKVLAEAQELYRLGTEKSGPTRNDYYLHVKHLCEELCERPNVSDHIKQEANQLRYSSLKGMTLEASNR